MWHVFLYDDRKFFVVMDGICASDLFQASAFSKSYNGKRAKGFFYNFDVPVICASALLEYRLDLVMLDYMVLIMVYIIYHNVFVGGAVVFNRVGQLFEFPV